MNNYNEDFKDSLTLKNQSVFIDFQSLDEEQLRDWLNIACKNGDLPLVRYLLTNKDLQVSIHGQIDPVTHEYNELPLLHAVKYNQYEIIEYLCVGEELNDHVNLRFLDDYILRLLAKDNNIDMIEYLVNHNTVKNKPEITKNFITDLTSYSNTFPTFSYYLNNCYKYNIEVTYEYLEELLLESCKSGQLEIIEYLLTDAQYKVKLTTDILNNCCFTMFACNEVRIVEYLLNEEKNGAFCKRYLENMLSLEDEIIGIKYLIDEQHFEMLTLLLSIPSLTSVMQEIICLYAKEDLISYIINDWSIPYLENIEKLILDPSLRNAFTMRELKEKLNEELKTDNKDNGKTKI